MAALAGIQVEITGRSAAPTPSSGSITTGQLTPDSYVVRARAVGDGLRLSGCEAEQTCVVTAGGVATALFTFEEVVQISLRVHDEIALADLTDYRAKLKLLDGSSVEPAPDGAGLTRVVMRRADGTCEAQAIIIGGDWLFEVASVSAA